MYKSFAQPWFLGVEVDDGASDTTGGAPRPGGRDENGAGVSWRIVASG